MDSALVEGFLPEREFLAPTRTVRDPHRCGHRGHVPPGLLAGRLRQAKRRGSDGVRSKRQDDDLNDHGRLNGLHGWKRELQCAGLRQAERSGRERVTCNREKDDFDDHLNLTKKKFRWGALSKAELNAG
jgi:hypothetical protein